MRRILKFLRVIQFISNEERTKQGLPKLGRGFFEAHRLNPYNPLSYITVIIIIVIGIIMFGVVGFFKEIPTTKPFTWD